ncbi:MAG TPA: DUF3810 domain-containing protein [Blastocatellia bacterium]|nr:DUF3810 domain-containing protein [Blastocatellia bacterium]
MRIDARTLNPDEAARLKERGAIPDYEVSRALTRLYVGAGLLAAAVGLQLLAGLAPHLVERYYSRGLYGYVARALSLINRWFSFSLAEALLVLLSLGLAWWLAAELRRLWKRQVGLRCWLFTSAVRLTLLAGGGALAFLLLWGLNYQREPLSGQMGLDERAPTVDELEAISRTIIDGINRSYAEAGAGQAWAGESRLPFDRSRLCQLIEEAYQREPFCREAGQAGFGPPKPVFFSDLLSRFYIKGVFNPFTGEPNFNAGQPDSELPFTIAHEKAHQRGFAREDDASFVAFLVCTGSADPYVRYSGYLSALGIVGRFGGMLVRESLPPDRYREIYRQLGPGPRADLKAISAFWGRYQGQLSQVSQRVNDSYLRANRVAGGVASYGGVDGLIIRYYLKHPAGTVPRASGERVHRKARVSKGLGSDKEEEYEGYSAFAFTCCPTASGEDKYRGPESPEAAARLEQPR